MAMDQSQPEQHGSKPARATTTTTTTTTTCLDRQAGYHEYRPKATETFPPPRHPSPVIVVEHGLHAIVSALLSLRVPFFSSRWQRLRRTSSTAFAERLHNGGRLMAQERWRTLIGDWVETTARKIPANHRAHSLEGGMVESEKGSVGTLGV